MENSNHNGTKAKAYPFGLTKEQAIHNIRLHAGIVGDELGEDARIAADALETIGSLLHNNVSTGDINLSDRDVEGLALAVRVIGSHIGDLACRAESQGDYLGSLIGIVEGES